MVVSLSIESINEILKSDNPFDRPCFVKQEDVWNKNFPDVDAINAHVSDAVFNAVSQIREKRRKTIGITITAERGLGKSHVISRIRRHLQADGSAFFVYMNEYGNLDNIKREFLHTLSSSLKHIGSCGVTQWQEIATVLLNDAYKKDFHPQQLVNRIIPGEISKYSRQNRQPVDFINSLVPRVLQAKPSFDDPYLIQAILWTLYTPFSPFAYNWLAGRSIAQAHADAMGLPPLDNADEDTAALASARKILNLIGEYKTVVICFDELDGAGINQSGMVQSMVVASLAKDISNDFHRGVILTAMYPDTFSREVKTMPNAEAVTDRIAEKVIDLEPLNSDGVVALVSTWLENFYTEKGITPPNPVYPFEEAKLKQIGLEKPIVRKVLQWCKDNFGEKPDEPVQVKIKQAYEKGLTDLNWAIDDYLEDKQTISNALRLGFRSLIGTNQEVEKVEVTGIEEILARGADKGYIDFKIIGKELVNTRKSNVRIGVAVAQQSSSTAVTSTLNRLKDYEKFGLTRGCMVRSKTISNKARVAYETLREFLQNKGEWVLLVAEQIKPLLAILFIHLRIEDYEFTEQDLFEFVNAEKLVVDNPLIREILSKPVGKIPNNAKNEDLIPVPPCLPTESVEDVFN